MNHSIRNHRLDITKGKEKKKNTSKKEEKKKGKKGRPKRALPYRFAGSKLVATPITEGEKKRLSEKGGEGGKRRLLPPFGLVF